MAVTSVTELPDAEGGRDRLYQRTYRRKFLVECDGRTDGPVTIRATTNGSGQPALPTLGNSYYRNATEKDLGSFVAGEGYRCVHAGPNPEGSTWEVTVEYAPYDTATFGADPVSWPLRYSFGEQKYERAAAEDVDGNPVSSSAGTPFEKPITVDDTRTILTVVRNELVSSFDRTLADQYRDSINLYAWNGYPLKTVKCASITTGDPQYDSNNQVYYFAVTYTFELNRDTWVETALDQSYAELDGSGKLTDILDAKGQKVSEPQLLDGSGHVLAPAGTPVFLEFRVYKENDFAGLNIDLSTGVGA